MGKVSPITSNSLQKGLVLSCKNNTSPSGEVLIAGDLYPGGRAESLLANGAGDDIWGDLTDEMAQHDFCIANLECPITNTNNPIAKSGPAFRALPDCAKGILAGGFQAVSMANNHIKDMGASGVIDSMDACKALGLQTVGAGRNLEEASQPLTVSANGLRIAILAITENEFSIAGENSAGSNPLDLVENFRQIRRAKDQADFVLVLFHGGVEHYPLPTPSMAKVCRFFVEAGADGVVCNHIHVPSGLEIFNSVPIVYSTGNFLFDWWPNSKNNKRFDGYMVSLQVQKHSVTSLKLIPYFQTIDECRVRSMKNQDSHFFLSEIAELSAKISDPASLDKEYNQLVQSKKLQYLSAVLSLGRIERRLFKMGIWPTWRISPDQLVKLKNQISCETHQELVVSVLESEIIRLHS